MDSTIIGALIGAAATILAAFIGRDYAQRRIDNSKPSQPLDRTTATIISILSTLTIKSARVIRLKEDKVHVDQELGLVLVLRAAWIDNADINISTFDGQNFASRWDLGSVVPREINGTQYYLILTSVDILSHSAKLQVRKKLH
jgi:phosphatidylserine synthase